MVVVPSSEGVSPLKPEAGVSQASSLLARGRGGFAEQKQDLETMENERITYGMSDN